ncbi:MAG: glycosyltransferase family 4 protein [Candidatus Aenigmatarchaeota archaeon]
MKICHITTVHPLNDTRIFLKECKSLVNAGYDVYLIVTADKDTTIDGVKILGLPSYESRIKRMLLKSRIAFKRALEVNADIYHFHDPELIPIGLKLKKLGKKVIYDVHEDVPRDILSKHYISKHFRFMISKIFEIYENYASKKFDYLITATPHIRDRFTEIGCRAVDVQNMPILEEFTQIEHDWSKKEKAICYVGGINKIRGCAEIINSVKDLNDVKLYLAGRIEENMCKDFIDKISSENTNMIYLGFLDRKLMSNIFKKVMAGLVLFHPEDNHINALPNKLFEYMSAGLPVIASDFPLWKEIIETNNCGICVNPFNIKEISNAINYIVNNPLEAKKMGDNGRKVVLEKYNWETEKFKLLEIYKNLEKF